MELKLPDPMPAKSLQDWLNALPDEVLRAKGIVRFSDEPDRWFQFQYVEASAEEAKLYPLPAKPVVPACAVLIGVKLNKEMIEAIIYIRVWGKGLRRMHKEVVGAGAAGVGMAATLTDYGVEDLLLIDRHEVGARSYALASRDATDYTLIFNSTLFGSLDLNAIALNTSVANLLEEEHPTGSNMRAILKRLLTPNRSRLS